MSMIELVAPVLMDEPPPAGLEPAPRRPFTEPIHVALIDNGKPKARELLESICEALNTHIPVASSRLIAKGSASRVIDDEEIEAYRFIEAASQSRRRQTWLSPDSVIAAPAQPAASATP